MIQGNMYLVRPYGSREPFVAVFLNKLHGSYFFEPTPFAGNDLFFAPHHLHQASFEWAEDLGPITPTTDIVDVMSAIKRLRID
jgi:hypothetical protein